jgi:serine/threonine-protein kinase
MFPSYASAHAGLADAYMSLALWGLARPREVFPKALRAARQALKLDPSLPQAYSSLATATAFYERRWEEGTAYARTATELEPSYSFCQHVYGSCLLARGELDGARECFERAVDLDPLSVRAHRLLGWMLHLARRPALAEQWLQAALVLDHERSETQYMLAHVYMSQRRFAAALEQAERSHTDSHDPLSLSVLGACLAHLNRREEAFKIVATLERMAEAGYVGSYAMAQVHIALGNIDRAMDSVNKSLDEREPVSAFLKLDPQFDPLREHPRFGELGSRLGL